MASRRDGKSVSLVVASLPRADRTTAAAAAASSAAAAARRSSAVGSGVGGRGGGGPRGRRGARGAAGFFAGGGGLAPGLPQLLPCCTAAGGWLNVRPQPAGQG